MRALAQRSAAAAKTTADLIEQSVASARGGVALNGEASRHLVAINDQISRVGQVLGDVATASDRQSRGIGQINGAIAQLGQLTQGSAANAEESAAAAAELSGQSAQMQALVGAYQLTDAQDARDGDARPALDAPAAPRRGPLRRPAGDPATRRASAALVGATAASALRRWSSCPVGLPGRRSPAGHLPRASAELPSKVPLLCVVARPVAYDEG